jgi:hypothetical protein
MKIKHPARWAARGEECGFERLEFRVVPRPMFGRSSCVSSVALKQHRIGKVDSLQRIAHDLGGEISGHQVLAPGPGHSSHDRSLAVRPSCGAPDGLLIFSHSGDDWRTCRDYVIRRLGITNGATARASRAERSKPRKPEDSEKGRIERAEELWRQGVDPRGTLVEAHLKGRALTLPPELAGEVVRFHPACPWLDRDTGAVLRLPTMLAVMRNLATNEITAVQRTAFTPEGRKIERRMLGVASEAAIKLDDDAAVTAGLIVGEGFETCLAAQLAGFRPVWEVGSAAAIKALPVLPGIEAITILTEVGDGGTNNRAAQTCAARWTEAGQEAFVVAPLVGGDFNDVWREAER